MWIHSADAAGSAFGVIPDANFGRFLRFVNISSDAYKAEAGRARNQARRGARNQARRGARRLGRPIRTQGQGR